MTAIDKVTFQRVNRAREDALTGRFNRNRLRPQTSTSPQRGTMSTLDEIELQLQPVVSPRK